MFKKNRYFRKLKVGVLGKFKTIHKCICLSLFPSAVNKTLTKMNLEGKGFIRFTGPSPSSRDVKAETQGTGLKGPKWSKGGSKKTSVEISTTENWQVTASEVGGLGENRQHLSFQNA